MSELNSPSSGIRRFLLVSSDSDSESENNDNLTQTRPVSVLECRVSSSSVAADNRPRPDSDSPQSALSSDMEPANIDSAEEDDPLPLSAPFGLRPRPRRPTSKKLNDDVDVQELYEEVEFDSDCSSLFSHSSDDYMPSEKEIDSASSDEDVCLKRRKICKNGHDDIDFDTGRPKTTSTPVSKKKRGTPADSNLPSISTARVLCMPLHDNSQEDVYMPLDLVDEPLHPDEPEHSVDEPQLPVSSALQLDDVPLPVAGLPIPPGRVCVQEPPAPLPVQMLEDARNWFRVYPPECSKDVRRKFRQRYVGPTNIPEGTSTPIQFLFLFLTDAIWAGMVNATNAFANASIASRQLDGTHLLNTRLYKWVDVTIEEMQKFWALLINMVLSKRERLESYWATTPNLFTPFYSQTMSLRRFQLILSNFQVSSRPFVPRGQPGYNPWVKVSDFIDPLVDSFRRYFIPNQELCIDESMFGMKNRYVFIQYMPNKRHARFAIKKFDLCDSHTGYVLDSVMYSGMDFLNEGPDAFTQKVVMHLLGRCNLLNKRYHLFTDNYYTKLPLARLLYSNKTYLTGTVNKRSKELSKTVLSAKLGVGESLYFRKGVRDNILLVKYKEAFCKPVHLITTACHAENVLVGRGNAVVNKPVVIQRYNKHMGGVDCKDKSVYHATCSRQTTKYWKKIVFNYMDMAILNSYNLYRLSTQHPMSWDAFMNNIVMSLVRVHQNVAHPLEPAIIPDAPSHACTPGASCRYCDVCKDRGVKKRTVYSCVPCNVGVHPQCFHQLKHWTRNSQGRRATRPPQAD